MYVLDYMRRKNMHETAEIFAEEANVCPKPVAIDSPNGFLSEWWPIFWDAYSSKQPRNSESQGESSLQATEVMGNELQNIFRMMPNPFNSQATRVLGNELHNTIPLVPNMFNSQATQILGNEMQDTIPTVPKPFTSQATQIMGTEQQNMFFMVPKPQINRQMAGQFPAGMSFDKMLPPQMASLLAAKMSEQDHLRLPAGGSRSNLQILDVDKLTITKASSSSASCSDKQTLQKSLEWISRDKAHSSGLGTSTPLDSTRYRVPTPRPEIPDTGFSFKEFGSLRSSTNKILCCNFSSDGKYLASAGYEKKVTLWNIETFTFVTTSEEHDHLVTDIRFRPKSTVFATSSYDRTVRVWNATKPRKSLSKLLGHTGQVMSLDFHPKNLDLLCSCDSNNEIRLWNVNQCACRRISRGASRQVRFQPQAGKLLAATSGNSISLIDVETNALEHQLEGHVKDVHSICWDTSGNYITSVSEDSARVWSILSGEKSIHELPANGNTFESCIFHPGYSQLVVVGSFKYRSPIRTTM